MVILRKPPFYLVSEPTIQKPEDLSGKRVGVDRIGSLQHLVARLILKGRGLDPEKAIFTQTGSVSNTTTSLAQGAISAAVLSGPHNVIMAQKGFREIGSAAELPVHFPTSGLVVHENRLKSRRRSHQERDSRDDRNHRVYPREKAWTAGYIRDKWKIDTQSRRNCLRPVAFHRSDSTAKSTQGFPRVFRSGLCV